MEDLKSQVQKLLRKYGNRGYRIAKAHVLQDKRIITPIRPILRYLIEECWPNMQHPALISLACEAVGGKPEAPDEVSAGIVLLTGAADMHDDIVDKSRAKGSLPTAYGKFGSDLVLLAGDILLLKALTQLNCALARYPLKTQNTIRRLVESSFYELGTATAAERTYKRKLDVDPAKYRELINRKGAVAEACARIGAIIGRGSIEEIEAMGTFGRALGVLMTLNHEFHDMSDSAELNNRWKNETLPLPIFYAFQDKESKHDILCLMTGRMTKRKANGIASAAMKTAEVEKLKADMIYMARDSAENTLRKIQANKRHFALLLRLAVEGL